jgi:rhamnosyltransferase
MRPALTLDRVAAVVVTFHPDASVLENLAALRPQAGTLIVVDNGSSPATLAPLQQAAAHLDFYLIANAENLGIATALNLGIRHAIAHGATALLLFDQDSQVTPGFTTAMLHCFQALQVPKPLGIPAKPLGIPAKPLGILVPTYADPMSLRPLPTAATLTDGTLATAITSGSLILAQTLQTHGLFVDELFIDSVDHEYSLRLRRAGLSLAACPNALLLHAMGTPRPHTLLGLLRIHSSNYSPVRRYYQERNKIWIVRHYAFDFPGFCLASLLRTLIDLTKVLWVEQDKAAKCRFMLRGIRDGIRGRMGRLTA